MAKQKTRQITLWDSLAREQHEASWTRTDLPQIASRGIKHLILNFETTGLKWWEGDRPLSCALLLPDGTSHYLSWGHCGGNDTDEETARRWLRREVRDLHLINQNTRFDLHMARAFGVNFEDQNVTVSDISHTVALLDDHRLKFALDTLAEELLGGVRIERLDENLMATYHSAMAAPRAKYNVELVQQLHDLLQPQIIAQGLERVQQLENDVIYPVVEMEENGTHIDVERLERWIPEVDRKAQQALDQLSKMLGFTVDPNKREDREKMWKRLDLPLQYTGKKNKKTKEETLSFTDAITKLHAEHPAIKLFRYAVKLRGLNSKYFRKYKDSLGSGDILRYSLHQLRSMRDPLSDYASGTITGRFSSTALSDGRHDIGVNIQQVMKVARQRVAFGYDEKDASHDDEIFLVRKLHIPPSGTRWLSADAMQIEYRIFASYANNPHVLRAYDGELDRYWDWVDEGMKEGSPNEPISFHKYMHERIRIFKPDQTYRQQKDLNFAYLYGAGIIKQAKMLGFITEEESRKLYSSHNYDDPRLADMHEIRRIYKQELPEVDDLLAEAQHLYKEKCDKYCRNKDDRLHRTLEHRGYVCTLSGRRGRSSLDEYGNTARAHKAFNIVDQGSAADIMKMKLVALHRYRKETGFVLRFTVHDEVNGDAQDVKVKWRVREILNEQSYPELRVPILWEVSTGANWAEVKQQDDAFIRAEETRSDEPPREPNDPNRKPSTRKKDHGKGNNGTQTAEDTTIKLRETDSRAPGARGDHQA